MTKKIYRIVLKTFETVVNQNTLLHHMLYMKNLWCIVSAMFVIDYHSNREIKTNCY